MAYIYVLLCDNNCYYIGKTYRDVKERVLEHFTNNGSCWTKKYRPLKIVETIQSNDKMDEDKYTKKYMSLYGIDKVRGGSYTEIILPKYKLLCLKDELCTMDDLCFRCMRRGHFVEECYAKTTVGGILIESDTESGTESCERCGRVGHSIDRCYAKKTVDGLSTDLLDTISDVSKAMGWFWKKMTGKGS